MSAKILVPFQWGHCTQRLLSHINTCGQGYELSYGNPHKYLTLEEIGHDEIQAAHARQALARAYQGKPDAPHPPLAAA